MMVYGAFGYRPGVETAVNLAYASRVEAIMDDLDWDFLMSGVICSDMLARWHAGMLACWHVGINEMIYAGNEK